MTAPTVGQIYWDRHDADRYVRVVALEGGRVRVRRVIEQCYHTPAPRWWVPYFRDERTSTVRLDRWEKAFEELK